jgi:hypothetical protein
MPCKTSNPVSQPRMVVLSLGGGRGRVGVKDGVAVSVRVDVAGRVGVNDCGTVNDASGVEVGGPARETVQVAEPLGAGALMVACAVETAAWTVALI